MIYDKKLRHPLNKSGKELKHKVINPESGKEELISYSLKKISENTIYKVDGEIYDDLYMFLSELTHINFITAGNFISFKDKKFTVESKFETKIYQTIILQLFFSWLLLEASILFVNLSKEEKKTISKQINESGMILHNYLLNIEIKDERIIMLKDNLLKRLNEVIKFN